MVKKKGKLFIISGPSGAGKSTLINDVLNNLENFVISVSVTTRPMRQNEHGKKKYRYISEEEFKSLIKKDELLEYAEYCGFYYGTPGKFVKEQMDKGKNVILEIDVKGAVQVREKINDVFMIFIMTPTLKILGDRLRKRNTESKEDIEKRLEAAEYELGYQKYYDCIIINNDYNEALLNLLEVLKKGVTDLNEFI